MPVRALAITILAPLLCASVTAAPALEWKEARSIRSASFVALQRGDVLLMRLPTSRVNALLVGYMAGPAEVAAHLRSRWALLGQVAASAPASSNLIGMALSTSTLEMSESLEALVKSDLTSADRKLSRQGWTTSNIALTRVEIPAVHVQGQRHAYSAYAALLLDAQQALGVPGTVAVIFRRDHERRWGLRSPHDPFSFWWHRMETLVVDTSVFLAAAGDGVLAPKHLGVIGPEGILGSTQPWDELRQAMLR